MSYKMFIDDERFPVTDEFIITRTSHGALAYMRSFGCPEFISFDHDLGGSDTAMKVVNWMIDKDFDSGGKFISNTFSFYVHSQNPVGKKNIEDKLNSYLNFR